MALSHSSASTILPNHQSAPWVVWLRSLPYLTRHGLMAVIIFTLAYSSILLTRMADDLAVLWLPNASTAVVLLCTREVNRSGIYVGAAAAITLANLAFGDPLWRAAAFAGAFGVNRN